MTKGMESLQDLLEEVKLRTVWWVLCIFAVSYFLTRHYAALESSLIIALIISLLIYATADTSKSMLMNIPIAVLLVSGLRILFNEVEFRWKVQNNRQLSYLSHLEKKQLSVNDSRLTTMPPPQKWKRKIDSPVVEAAIEDFISKLLQDFVVDLWYSDITPDKEAPELIHAIVMDVLGEVSGRLKELNLVDLLTRDVVDLIGDHLDLFRRNQAAIGVDVMGTLSSEERDERLKHHLLASKELHPALISPECEYKVLQRLVGGLVAVVLRPREAQCPLVRCIARELLTCLVMQPIMNFASPGYINELIEYIILAYNNEGSKNVAADQSPNMDSHNHEHKFYREHGQSSESNLRKSKPSSNQGTDLSLVQFKQASPESGGSGDLVSSTMQDETIHAGHAEWAKVFEAATQRRTEVLMPENLENMWTIGRNYKKKLQKKAGPGSHAPQVTGSVSVPLPRKDLETELPKQKPEMYIETEDKASLHLPPRPQQDTRPTGPIDALSRSQELNEKVFAKGSSSIHELEKIAADVSNENRNKLKRSNSTSDLKVQSTLEDMFVTKGSAPIINEYYSADINKLNVHSLMSSSDMVLRREGHVPKLRCRVTGAYFEKHGSKSFAVYSIAVTDAGNNTWFVKRRYRNFERLHRHLKDIPNYTLHLPPKRIFSSSTEDAFVHQRCIQLDKYLQDLLSIANVAEQHEVWDFLSASSKFFMHEELLFCEIFFCDEDSGRKQKLRAKLMAGIQTMWSKGFPQRVVRREEDVSNLESEEIHNSRLKSMSGSMSRYPESSLAITSVPQEDPTGVPPEWTPPNLSVPVLNLVDNVFQLKKRGWLRRQVFWISKQILQLIMEDAIDDWLLRQIQWLRREDVIAQGIRWVQDVLWPGGTFFLRLRAQAQPNDCEATRGSQQTTRQPSGMRSSQPGSFEQQLEAARRANDVKKMIFKIYYSSYLADGAPTTLVSLIGHKQYRRCARDCEDGQVTQVSSTNSWGCKGRNSRKSVFGPQVLVEFSSDICFLTDSIS
ncbi:UNVERIFIED_CONTAM: hypothetical protein Sradi_2809800 [Sesamum radiatum]|uniref:Sorting nexin-13 n=1 Tax=Sesamum radiatum TaxID=300843 RepID=A0AAW2RV03_SESRA